jgi:hypothetical protein
MKAALTCSLLLKNVMSFDYLFFQSALHYLQSCCGLSEANLDYNSEVFLNRNNSLSPTSQIQGRQEVPVRPGCLSTINVHTGLLHLSERKLPHSHEFLAAVQVKFPYVRRCLMQTQRQTQTEIQGRAFVREQGFKVPFHTIDLHFADNRRCTLQIHPGVISL